MAMIVFLLFDLGLGDWKTDMIGLQAIHPNFRKQPPGLTNPHFGQIVFPTSEYLDDQKMKQWKI